MTARRRPALFLIAAASFTCRFSASKLAPCTDNAACGQGLWCGDAGFCVEQVDLGWSCQRPDECLSGYCVDGLCCESTCPGKCRSCAIIGRRGVCSKIAPGQDPNGECTGAQGCAGACDGDGGCAYPGAETVCASTCDAGATTVSRCASGECVAGGSTSCALYACNAAGTTCHVDCAGQNECNVAAAYCVDAGCAPKKDAGAYCQGGVECASGACLTSSCQ